MKILSIILAIILAGVSHAASAQNISSNVEDVIRALNLRGNKSAYDAPYGCWLTSNKNQQFYSSDTITFYNTNNYPYPKNNCFDLISWKFDSATTFKEVCEDNCREPPLVCVDFDSELSRHLKTDNPKSDILLIENNNKQVTKYKILSLTLVKSPSQAEYYALKLLRLKQ